MGLIYILSINHWTNVCFVYQLLVIFILSVNHWNDSALSVDHQILFKFCLLTGRLFQVNDSAMTLLGETQEEDRKHIAELTLSKMQATLKPVHTTMYVFKVIVTKEQFF